LKQTNPNFNGLTGQETNPIDPSNPSLGTQRVSFDAPSIMRFDPGHSIEATKIELWGQEKQLLDPAPMNGFISELVKGDLSVAEARLVMQCHNATSASVISSLASEYAVFDSWHASIPGPTFPNRIFAWTGTSHGFASNDFDDEFIKGFPQRAIFDDIVDAKLDYRVYFSDFPTPFVVDSVARRPWDLRPIQEFAADARAGTLPSFSWVEPRFFTFAEFDEEDQHPQGTVSWAGEGSFLSGERFLKWVYEELRASPNWNKTALLVYYDEHGGLYDHVSPPQHGVPNPDGLNSTDPPFSFDRLGIRVPAVLVSPAVPRGSIVRPIAGKHFDHTTLLATMRRVLHLSPRPLTAREAWIGSFEHHFSARQQPCPDRVALHADAGSDVAHHKYVTRVLSDDGTERTYRRAAKRRADLVAAQKELPISDLQRNILLAARARAAEPDKADAELEYEAAQANLADAAMYVRRRMSAHLAQHKQNKN
jgi:phospholipase C